MHTFKTLLLALFLILPTSFAIAEESESSGGETSYIELKPFITNFGGVGKSRFVKCEITIQVESSDAHHFVNLHIPQIRNDIVFLLSDQTEDTLRTVEDQNILAKKALQAVQDILLDETGETYASDLFFTSFVIQ